MEDQSKFAERILDQIADAVIYADRSGAIVRWNRASAALFGYSPEEALGQSLDLIVPEHLRASHWSGFNAAMTRGALKLQGRPTLTRAAHKSGRKLYVELTFAVVKGDDEGEVLGSVAMARDVTERVERERAARRAWSALGSPYVRLSQFVRVWHVSPSFSPGWAAPHFTGVVFIADLILIAALVVGTILGGWALYDGTVKLYEAITSAIGAQTEAELDEAATLMAEAVTTLGVVLLSFVLIRPAR
jgi:PAS domain S-box-containing protein